MYAVPTVLISRHAAQISVSAAMQRQNRNMYIPLTVPALLLDVPSALFWKTISRLTAALLFRKFCVLTWAAMLLPHRKNKQFNIYGSALKGRAFFVFRILHCGAVSSTIFYISSFVQKNAKNQQFSA